MAHTIHGFPRAMADIRSAVSWSRQQSRSAAMRLYVGLFKAIRSLADNPERCPLADEASELGLELRRLLYGRRRNVYRILFIIEGQTVNVLRVRHAAQDRLAADDLWQ